VVVDGDNNNQDVYSRLVTKIVVSYVQHHTIDTEILGALIRSLHRTLEQLGQPAAPPAVLTPAVPVRRSVQHDRVACLDCGWHGKMLRRHLSTRHGLTSAQYLERWNLQADHPLTAPDYSRQRSTLAKELGLGRASRVAALDSVEE
jgi:predicted transcriptional regulator